MAIIEITTKISFQSLMKMSKYDLADMVLRYADANSVLHKDIARLSEALETKIDAKMECQHRERMAVLEECLSELKALEGKEPQP